MIASKKNINFSLIIFVFLINFSSSAVLSYYRVNNEPGLYFPHDDVTILTIENFNISSTSIYGSNKAWLVEFYSNWCGYCQRAAPRYKAFATDVKGWSDLVVVAALDCANEKNGPICEYFRITRYPTFRYIHEGYVEDPNNTGLPIIADSHTNYTEHRQNLVNILRKEQTEGRGKMFPNLQPFNESDASKIFNKDSQKLGFLIIQEPSDVVGPSVILDFHKVKELIISYSYNNETSVTTETLPALFQVNKSGQLNPLTLNPADRQGIKIVIRDILLAMNIEVPFDILKNVSLHEDDYQFITTTKEEELRKKIKEMGDVVYQLDLENALRYSLKREVGSNVEIQGKKLEALRKYIDVLVKYFPFGPRGKCLLKQIKQYANSTSTVNGTQIAMWIKEADEQSQNVFSGPPQWLGCKGSTPTKRGYPCGMWKLFHYLTVNAAFDQKNTKDSNPRIVLEAMHGYIKHYFGCEDCSDHFQEMAAKRELSKVISWEESILWLWRAHNEVNKRLSGDTTEDPLFPKIQFPGKESCPQCWKKNDTPDEIEILSYLKQMYATENIKYMGINDPLVSHLNMPDTSSSDKNTPSEGSRTFNSNLTFAICGFLLSVLFIISG